MKTLTLTLIAILTLSACGKPENNNFANGDVSWFGTWHDQSNNDILIGSNYSLTSASCALNSVFTAPSKDGQSTLTVNSSNNHLGCFAIGTYQCKITYYPSIYNVISFTCNGTDHTFGR